jgi:hypothetical protein
MEPPHRPLNVGLLVAVVWSLCVWLGLIYCLLDVVA